MIGFIKSAGGMPGTTKKLLVPENIREGVRIKGGGVDTVGAFSPQVLFSSGVGWFCWASGNVERTYTITEPCEVHVCGSYMIVESDGMAFNANCFLRLNGTNIQSKTLAITNRLKIGQVLSAQIQVEAGDTISAVLNVTNAAKWFVLSTSLVVTRVN